MCCKCCFAFLPDHVDQNPDGFLGKKNVMWQDNSAPAQAKEGRRWKEETTLKKSRHVMGKDVHIKHDDEKKKQKHGENVQSGGLIHLCAKWTILFHPTNIFYACYGFMKALINKPYMPTSYYFAKAGGGILNFNCAVILVPVLRNILLVAHNASERAFTTR